MGGSVVTQTHFQTQADDNTDVNLQTLLGSEDTRLVIELDTTYVVRFKMAVTGMAVNNGNWQLEYNVDGAGWNSVTTTSSNVRAVAGQPTDGDQCSTERLTNDGGTFITTGPYEESGVTPNYSLLVGETELAYSIQFRSADLTAGNENIDLRITFGAQSITHNEVDVAQAPAAATPMAAYTPVPTLKHSFERHIQQLPQLDEFPEPPIEPATPATFERVPTIKRRDTRRQLAKLPIAHEFPETPVVPVSVVAETPALQANRSEFKRQRQLVAHNPAYPAPPGISVVAQTPALKANRVEFIRKLQTPLELNEHPETPLVVSTSRATQDTRPFVTFTTKSRALRAPVPVAEYVPPPALPPEYPSFLPPPTHRQRFDRNLQRLPQLDEFPETPPGFFAGQWPASDLLRSNAITFDRSLQDLPNPHVYPRTPVPFTAYTPVLKSILSKFERELQKLPQLDEFPPTPAGFFDGFYPGSARVEAFTWTFERKVQTLELNEYPQTPVAADDYPALTPVITANRSQFERQLQPTLNPHVYPETPPGFFEGFFPAPIRLKRIPSAYHRKAQVPLDLFERPPTPPGFFDGFYPGSARVNANRTAFDRELQTLPQLDQFTPTPLPADDFAAYTPVPTIRRRDTKRTLQTLGNPHVYPPTPPGFFEGFYPGSAGVRALRVSFARNLNSVPPLWEFPQTPPPPLTAYTFAPKAFSVRFERTLRQLPQLDQFTPTPPGFFAGFWPGSRRVEALLSEFKRQIQQLPQLDEFKPTPPPASIIATMPPLMANRSEFARTRLQLPPHDEYPATPPSIIEMPAPYAMLSIRRNELGRQLQPVWDPSGIVSEGFKEHDDECRKWAADRFYSRWEADSTWLTWEAEKICD